MIKTLTDSLGVNIVVEGKLDESILRRVLNHIDMPVLYVYGKKGKDYLREKTHGFNEAAKKAGTKWVILVDLNAAECPPKFIKSWLPAPHRNLQFRIAVHAAEAWLLADRKAIARFLSVPENKIPMNPEESANPKETLIQIVKKHSKKRAIRESIIPLSGMKEGPNYNGCLAEFIMKYWAPERATAIAPSFNRCINSLRQCKKRCQL